MEKTIICKRANKEIYIEDNKCYKVFEEGYNIGDVLNEALNHARIEETDLNVPHLFGVFQNDQQWSICMEQISGKNLEELMNENPDKIDEYIEQFVDIQIEIQSKRCPKLAKYRDKMNLKVDATDLSATLRYDLHNRIEAMPRHNYLCHGDYNPSNVIIDASGKHYIIDWAHATQGNRAADAARTFLLFLLANQPQRAKKYIDTYSFKTGVSVDVILIWLPILAASQSVKGRINESDLLSKLITMKQESLKELYEKI